MDLIEMLQGRAQMKFLEDKGLLMMSKMKNDRSSTKPPKLRNKRFTFIEFLAKSGLKNLTPTSILGMDFPSRFYDQSNEKTYVDQCYIPIAKVGEGSYAHVMKVIFKDNNSVYALKLMKEPYRGENDRVVKLREVENHFLLSDHCNIVTLHNAWEEDGLLYMIMEPCKINLKQHGLLTEKDCWNILADMSSALAYIHEKGFGHFDIKPENILLGCDGLYKLCDFGLSFAINDPPDERPNEGDAKYLAPEILGGGNGFTEKADIFSLGISILELAGNVKLPSHGEVWKALRENTFPRRQTENMSDELLLIVVKMMASDPSLRPRAVNILNRPSVAAIVEQRRNGVPLMVYPIDKVHYFVFMLLVFYTLVHLVAKQFTKKTNVNSFKSQTKIVTSTPLGNKSGYPMSMSVDDGYMSEMTSSCSSHMLSMTQKWSEPSTSAKCVDSPDVEMSLTPSSLYHSASVFVDDSPMRLSRDLKQAIKRERSFCEMKAKIPRRKLFMDDDDDDDDDDEPENKSENMGQHNRALERQTKALFISPMKKRQKKSSHNHQ